MKIDYIHVKNGTQGSLVLNMRFSIPECQTGIHFVINWVNNVIQDSRLGLEINANDLEQLSQTWITGNMWPPSNLTEETHQTSQNPSLRFDSTAWAEIVRVRWANDGKSDYNGIDKYTVYKLASVFLSIRLPIDLRVFAVQLLHGSFLPRGRQRNKKRPTTSITWLILGRVPKFRPKKNAVHVNCSEGNIRDTTGRTCDDCCLKLGCQILESMAPRCQRLLTHIHGSAHPSPHQRVSQALREQQHLEYPAMI